MKTTITAIVLAFVMVAASIFPTAAARAEVKTKTVIYKDGDVTLKGYMAWDAAKSGKRPGVLVVYEWWGFNDFVRARTRRLAAAGYVAFAPDIYGDGKATNDAKQAGKWRNRFVKDIPLWLRRARLGLDVLKANPDVAPGKIAATGSSFGGETALRMAYAGQDVKAVVSFASSLPPAPKSVTSIKPRVLVFHGGDDLFVKPERVAAFKAALNRAKANWEMTIYSGTRHSFIVPAAGTHGIANMVYNEAAAERSWGAMISMFNEVFR